LYYQYFHCAGIINIFNVQKCQISKVGDKNCSGESTHDSENHFKLNVGRFLAVNSDGNGE